MMILAYSARPSSLKNDKWGGGGLKKAVRFL